MWYEIWKGEKLMFNERLFFSVDYPNQTLVGGISVNRICQQGGLFALSVNRPSVYIPACCELHLKTVGTKSALEKVTKIKWRLGF